MKRGQELPATSLESFPAHAPFNNIGTLRAGLA